MEAGQKVLLMVTRKTIEHKIILAVPGMNENSMDCGLPFYDKSDDAKKQINNLTEGIANQIFSFVEDKIIAAYRKR